MLHHHLNILLQRGSQSFQVDVEQEKDADAGKGKRGRGDSDHRGRAIREDVDDRFPQQVEQPPHRHTCSRDTTFPCSRVMTRRLT